MFLAHALHSIFINTPAAKENNFLNEKSDILGGWWKSQLFATHVSQM